MTSRLSAHFALAPVCLSALVLLMAGLRRRRGRDAVEPRDHERVLATRGVRTDLAGDPALEVVGAAPVEALMSDVGLGLDPLGRAGGTVPLDFKAAAAARPMPAAARGPAGAPAVPPYGGTSGT